MKKILILSMFLLLSFLHSKEIVINSDLDEEYIKDIAPNITLKNEASNMGNKLSFNKIGYIYSIGPLNEELDKDVESYSFYISEIYKNIGLNFIKKTHSSNLTYDVFGFGLNYSISKKWLISLNTIIGKGNSTDVDGIDASLLFLKNNYGFSLGYDSILRRFNMGITIFKGFRNE